ncbi:hypothetical protein ES702_01866 [subsurface metagenome]
MKPSLNLGCGDDERGDIRIDLKPPKKALNILADAHFLPIRDKAIGRTLCKSVLEHVEIPIKVLLEMKRITVDEIIIIVPNLMNVIRIWRTLINPLHKVSVETLHLQGWDAKLIKHLAHLTGLKAKKIKWIHYGSRRWAYICLPLLASHMIAILYDEREEVCSKCGTPKKRFWCDPGFTYCPKCDIEPPICGNTD